MREDTKTIAFAAAVCVTCSLLLSGTAALLKNRIDENAAFDVQRNIIKAFGSDIKGLGKAEVKQLADQYVQETVIDVESKSIIEGMKIADIPANDLEEKTKLPLYTWTENGQITKYAFPVSGKGLWGMVYGYLALDSDLNTIAGISFYKHAETPGLGAEIEKDWFTQQFKGKQIFTQGKQVELNVVKGYSDMLSKEEQAYSVDGISGATLTGNGVENLINTDVALYSAYFNKIRKTE